jgi:hypothetical protein
VRVLRSWERSGIWALLHSTRAAAFQFQAKLPCLSSRARLGALAGLSAQSLLMPTPEAEGGCLKTFPGKHGGGGRLRGDPLDHLGRLRPPNLKSRRT